MSLVKITARQEVQRARCKIERGSQIFTRAAGIFTVPVTFKLHFNPYQPVNSKGGHFPVHIKFPNFSRYFKLHLRACTDCPERVQSPQLIAQHIHQKKPRLRDRTDRAWFSRLVRHPARKRSDTNRKCRSSAPGPCW